MIEAVLNNPAWIAAVAGLVSAACSGWNLWAQARDRARRSRDDDPEFEVTMHPCRGWPGWWEVQIVVRNFWRSRLLLESITMDRPRGAKLMTRSAVEKLGGPGARPPAAGAGSRKVMVGLLLQPAGRDIKPEGKLSARYLGSRDSEAVDLWAALTNDATDISMSAVCIRKSRSERRMLFRIHTVVPAKNSSENA
jgi:hypothetical protein